MFLMLTVEVGFDGGEPKYQQQLINMDLVRTVAPTGRGAALIFDDNQMRRVLETIDGIDDALNDLQYPEPAAGGMSWTHEDTHYAEVTQDLTAG